MFTLGHLTDPHLAIAARVPLAALAGKRLIGFINWRRNRRFQHDLITLGRVVAHLKATATDHVVVTGDFVNIALPVEFDNLRVWLSSMGPHYDLTTIPGNHDVYVPGGLEMTQEACADTMLGDDGGKVFPLVKRRGPVAIIALNSGVPTRPFQATGLLGPKQVAALAGVLADLKREGLFRVVLIHHPPVSEISAHKRLVDAADLLRVVASHGAELVLHGHNHVHELHWLPGPSGRIPSVGVSSASGAPGRAKHPGAYNLYRISGEPDAWRCELESWGIGPDGKVGTVQKMMLLA